jgi:mannose/fructose-specific phosphotransferase system component IIA
MARALIKAAETILGKTTLLHGFSSTDMSTEQIAGLAGKIIESDDWPENTLIMVSLKGGSCWRAALTIRSEQQNVAIVAGINLSMLLSFITKRANHPLEELASLAKEDGIRGIDRYEEE